MDTQLILVEVYMNVRELTAELLSFNEHFRSMVEDQRTHLLNVTNNKIKSVAAMLTGKSEEVNAVKTELEGVSACLNDFSLNLALPGENAEHNMEVASQQMLTHLKTIHEKLKKQAASKATTPPVQNSKASGYVKQRTSPPRGNSPTREVVEEQLLFYAPLFSVPLATLRKEGIRSQAMAEKLEAELKDLKDVIPVNAETRELVNILLADWYLNQQSEKALNFIENLRDTKERLSRYEQLKKIIINRIEELSKKSEPNFLTIMRLFDNLRDPLNVPLAVRVPLLEKAIPEKQFQAVYDLCLKKNELRCAYLILATKKHKNPQLNNDKELELLSLKMSEIDPAMARKVASKIEERALREKVLKEIEDNDDSGTENTVEEEGRLRLEKIPLQRPPPLQSIFEGIESQRKAGTAPQSALAGRVSPQFTQDNFADNGELMAIIASLGEEGIVSLETAVYLEKSLERSRDVDNIKKARLLLVDWYIKTEAYARADDLIPSLDLEQAKQKRQQLKEAIHAKIKMCHERGDAAGAVSYAICLELEEGAGLIKMISLDKKNELVKEFLKKRKFDEAILCVFACEELTSSKKDDLLSLVMKEVLSHDLNYATVLAEYFSDQKLKAEMQKAVEMAKQREKTVLSNRQDLRSNANSAFARSLEQLDTEEGEDQDSTFDLINNVVKEQWQTFANSWIILALSVAKITNTDQQATAREEMIKFQRDLLSRTEKLLAEVAPEDSSQRAEAEHKMNEEQLQTLYDSMFAFDIKDMPDAKKLKTLIDKLPQKDLMRDQGTCALVNWHISQKYFSQPTVQLMQTIIDEKLRRETIEKYDKAKQEFFATAPKNNPSTVLLDVEKTEVRKEQLDTMQKTWETLTQSINILLLKSDKAILLEEIIMGIHKMLITLELTATVTT